MTLLEERLRTALADAPTPPAPAFDPLADLGRRVARARAWIAVAAVTGVVAVVAAIVVPLSLVGRSDRHRPAPVGVVRKHQLQHWRQSNVVGVAVGGGSVWSLEIDQTTRFNYFVVRRDQATGVVEQLFPVAGPQDFIAYGLHRVWVWGGALESGGLSPHERVIVIDPTTNTRAIARLSGRVNFRSLAFTPGVAWAPAHNHGLLHMRLHGGRIDVKAYPFARARYAIQISSREILFSNASGGLDEAPTSDLVKREIRGLTLLAPAPGYGVWTAQRRELSYLPHFGDPTTLRWRTPSSVVAVAGSPATGVYVGLANGEGAVNNPYLVYYSPAALRAAHPRPTARLLGTRQITQLLLDPAGGVLVADVDQQLFRWRPARP